MTERRPLRLTLTLWSQMLTPADLCRITLIECSAFSAQWNPACEGLPRRHSAGGPPRLFLGTIAETSEPEQVAPDTWKIVVTVVTAEPAEELAKVRLVDFAPDGPICWARATTSRDAIREADCYRAAIESVQVG